MAPLPLIEWEGAAMLPKAETACFAIADISGYTHFVSGVELDHAQDIIADIMDTLVRALRPPFRLAKFEGDAAFVYALADKVDGSLMQDSIEQAYFAFRKRLRSIKQANSCECQACSRMQSLDVKFVVHHGEFIRQKMSGREELAGRDVILAHRLLKNDVGKTFGPHAYALYSDACVQAMGIDPAAQGLVEHVEAIEHIGETKCWVCDLEQAWTREVETKRTMVQRADALMIMERDFAAPRQVVWDRGRRRSCPPRRTPSFHASMRKRRTMSRGLQRKPRRTSDCARTNERWPTEGLKSTRCCPSRLAPCTAGMRT
jgi:hypothetical protein